MINITNAQAIASLKRKYRVMAHMDGIINREEAELIRNELQLRERDEIGLRNLRDTVVLMSIVEDRDREHDRTDETSAFVHMIDTELWDRGLAV